MVDRNMPVVGEKVTTPDGDGYIVELISFDDDKSSKSDDRDWESLVRARVGQSYKDRYYRALVEIHKPQKIKSYHCWEIKFDANRDPEDAPWRS